MSEDFQLKLRNIWTFTKSHPEPLGVVLAFFSVCLALIATIAAFWGVYAQNAANRELANQQNAFNRELANQQNFFQFYQQWESDGMQERRARLAATLLENRSPNEVDDSALVFLETLSHASNQQFIDHDLTWNAFYYDLTNYWAAASQYALRVRKDEKCECIFSELEKANNQFLAEAKTRQGKAEVSKEEQEASVRRFLQWELKRRLNVEVRPRFSESEKANKGQDAATRTDKP